MSAVDHSVLVVDDDEMARSWIRFALEGSLFRLAGEAASAGEALELAGRSRPALLLVDNRLPDGTGTALVRALRRRGITAPALVMTANAERGFNEAARDAGAQGTVVKTGRAQELVAALEAIESGHQTFDPRHPARETGRGALSPRERDVLRLVARGLTNREIAESLGVGDETVKTLLARSFVKLGVRRRAEAVSAAHERGLL